MSQKTKMRSSGNSIAWTGCFVIPTKTNHNITYNRNKALVLGHKSCCGNRRTYGRNIFY